MANRVKVGYFIEWKNEYPDFGKKHKTSLANILVQFLIPLYYTNFIFIPKTGGLHYLLYGSRDVEGIFAVYHISKDSLSNLVSLNFELAGHQEIDVPNRQYQIDDVLKNNAPFIEVATWNHLFLPPSDDKKYQCILPQLFPEERWRKLKMNRKRADIVKKHLLQK